jgi:hypothetical protein
MKREGKRSSFIMINLILHSYQHKMKLNKTLLRGVSLHFLAHPAITGLCMALPLTCEIQLACSVKTNLQVKASGKASLTCEALLTEKIVS